MSANSPLDDPMRTYLQSAAVRLLLDARSKNTERLCWPLLGTGTLVRVAETHVLVTARHVLVDGGECIAEYVRVTNGSGVFSLTDCRVISFRPQESDLDVAAVVLNPAKAEELSRAGFLFLTFDSVRSGFGAEIGSRYRICGYPSSFSPPLDGRDAEPFTITTTLADPSEAQGTTLERHFDPRVHLLLRYEDSGQLGDGAKAITTSLKGMSGASVWCEWQLSKTNAILWEPDSHLRVWGVQTGVYPKKRLICATSWHVVAQRLLSECPELRPVLGPSYGW